jgi:hypothetical protein
MKKFNDLEFIEHPSTFGGVYTKTMFENGYGIMVWGGLLGKYDVDVLGSDGEPVYNTNVTNDTIYGADIDKINDVLELIQKL